MTTSSGKTLLERARELPIVRPLILFLSSERIIAGIILAIINGILLQFPSLEPHKETLIQLSFVLYLVFVALHTYVKVKLGGAEAEPGMVTPIWEPLIKVFSSRKFLLALAALAVDVAILVAPKLAENRDQLLLLVNAGVIYLQTILAVEDAKTADPKYQSAVPV